LTKEIVKQMSFYNPGISQATVNVIEYNSQSVVLTGAVRNPGKYRFEQIPNLLDILREAGGATDSADLSKITIIRQDVGQAKLITVDLLKVIKDGDMSKLPPLLARDMVHIPASSYGLAGQALTSPTFKGKDIYFIYGAVGSPGVKDLAEGIDLVDAITAAGGVTASADLGKIKVIMKDVQYSTVLNFNLNRYSKKGQPARYTLRPEDTIVVPFKREGQSLGQRLPELVIPGLITTIVTTIIVRELSSGSSNR